MEEAARLASHLAEARAKLDGAGGANDDRIAVLALLYADPRALGAEELVRRLDGTVPRLAVYAVLHWLVAAGFAAQAVSASGAWRFHPRRADTGLFECEQCGELRLLPMPTPAVRLPEHFSAGRAQYRVVGRCPACAASTAADAIEGGDGDALPPDPDEPRAS